MISGSLVAPFLPTFLILCASTSSALSCATSPVLMQAALVQTNRASLVVAQLSVARDHVVPFSKFLLVVNWLVVPAHQAPSFKQCDEADGISASHAQVMDAHTVGSKPVARPPVDSRLATCLMSALVDAIN
ncbi:TPA: hypothetical protein N0F65_004606 [Lagenidium giganteum]|uniref:Secreted protein n=1 Tax=Lagenidium giganteum TaxID=4803 RepID=A0AAV2ZDF2_9STRA|nr:TPA: hypothetical protein N0F65_004606 [Lagenidium giganteum]